MDKSEEHDYCAHMQLLDSIDYLFPAYSEYVTSLRLFRGDIIHFRMYTGKTLVLRFDKAIVRQDYVQPFADLLAFFLKYKLKQPSDDILKAYKDLYNHVKYFGNSVFVFSCDFGPVVYKYEGKQYLVDYYEKCELMETFYYN